MLLVLGLAPVALAAEPTFDKATPMDDMPAAETKLSAQVGGNFTTGNAESVTVTGGLDTSHRWKRNRLGAVAAINVGFGAVDVNADGFLDESERCIRVEGKDCASTAERYGADLRYDRFLSSRDSLYLLGGALHDPFVGFELRSHVQLGYARLLVNEADTHLALEAGADVAHEQYVEGLVPASTNLVAAQVALKFDHVFNEGVSFADALVVYEPILTQPEGAAFSPHFTDFRVSNVATLAAKVSTKLSVNVSDTVEFRNEPIAPPEGVTGTRSPIDNTLSVALVASIL